MSHPKKVGSRFLANLGPHSAFLGQRSSEETFSGARAVIVPGDASGMGFSVLVLVASFFLCRGTGMQYFWSILSGVVTGVLIGYVTELYTSDSFRSVREIANESETGAATTAHSNQAAPPPMIGVPRSVRL